jgi:hypothetical protein
VVCDEHGIGGDGEYCGGNDAQLGRISVFYHRTSGGNYVFRAALFGVDLAWGGQQLGQGPQHTGWGQILLNYPVVKQLL